MKKTKRLNDKEFKKMFQEKSPKKIIRLHINDVIYLNSKQLDKAIRKREKMEKSMIPEDIEIIETILSQMTPTVKIFVKLLIEENQKLKSENEFLMGRDNKLQRIEQLFNSEYVDLKKLTNLIKENEVRKRKGTKYANETMS